MRQRASSSSNLTSMWFLVIVLGYGPLGRLGSNALVVLPKAQTALGCGTPSGFGTRGNTKRQREKSAPYRPTTRLHFHTTDNCKRMATNYTQPSVERERRFIKSWVLKSLAQSTSICFTLGRVTWLCHSFMGHVGVGEEKGLASESRRKDTDWIRASAGFFPLHTAFPVS